MPPKTDAKRKERELSKIMEIDLHNYANVSTVKPGPMEAGDFALSPLPDSPLQSPATKKGKPADTIQDPDSIVDKLSALINSRADSLEKVFTLKIEGLKKTIDFMADEVKELKGKLKEVDAKAKMEAQRVKSCETRIAELERYSRRWNLRLAGVLEDDTENVTARVIDICQKTVANENVNVAQGIEIVHRLGKRDHSKRSPRNIIIRFSSRPLRDAVWKAAKQSQFLKNNRLRFAEDLTAEDREKRRALWPRIEEARARGDKAYFIAGRAFVNGSEIFPSSTT